MAFSDQDKTLIRFRLGYSVFENNSEIQRAIASLVSQPTAEPIIRPILAELDDIDAAISKVKKIAMAIEDGSVKLRAAYSLGTLRSMGRQQVRRLALILGCDVRNDIYGSPAESTYEGGYPITGSSFGVPHG